MLEIGVKNIVLSLSGIRLSGVQIPSQWGMFDFYGKRGVRYKYKTLHAAAGVTPSAYRVCLFDYREGKKQPKSFVTADGCQVIPFVLKEKLQKENASRQVFVMLSGGECGWDHFFPRSVEYLGIRSVLNLRRKLKIQMDDYDGADAPGLLPQEIKALIHDAWRGDLLPQERPADHFQFKNCGVRVIFDFVETATTIEDSILSLGQFFSGESFLEINFATLLIGERIDQSGLAAKNAPRYAGLLNFGFQRPEELIRYLEAEALREAVGKLFAKKTPSWESMPER